MTLQKDEYKIDGDGIWISRKALEELLQHYKRIVSNTVPYDMYFAGKSDVYVDLLKHFEPLEP